MLPRDWIILNFSSDGVRRKTQYLGLSTVYVVSFCVVFWSFLRLAMSDWFRKCWIGCTQSIIDYSPFLTIIAQKTTKFISIHQKYDLDLVYQCNDRFSISSSPLINLNDSAKLCSFPGGLRWIEAICPYSVITIRSAVSDLHDSSQSIRGERFE